MSLTYSQEEIDAFISKWSPFISNIYFTEDKVSVYLAFPTGDSNCVQETVPLLDVLPPYSLYEERLLKDERKRLEHVSVTKYFYINKPTIRPKIDNWSKVRWARYDTSYVLKKNEPSNRKKTEQYALGWIPNGTAGDGLIYHLTARKLPSFYPIIFENGVASRQITEQPLTLKQRVFCQLMKFPFIGEVPLLWENKLVLQKKICCQFIDGRFFPLMQKEIDDLKDADYEVDMRYVIPDAMHVSVLNMIDRHMNDLPAKSKKKYPPIYYRTSTIVYSLNENFPDKPVLKKKLVGDRTYRDLFSGRDKCVQLLAKALFFHN